MTGPGDDARRSDLGDPPPERVFIESLGISVTPLTGPDAATVAASRTGKRLLLNHNLHSAYVHGADPVFRDLYEKADWIVIDGAPILWLAARRAKSRLSPAYRITSTDWVDALPALGVSRRLFLFGASPTSNQRAIDRLKAMLPEWQVSGINGYVEPEIAIDKICRFAPDLVLIGLGMPLQEHFLSKHLQHLPDATYATVGGAIDYIAGTTNLAPRVVGKFGLEWLWRFSNEPRRLAHRYTIEPMYLIGRVLNSRSKRTRRS